MIRSYVLLGTLGVHSIEDVKEKKITVMFTLFSGILGIVLHLLVPDISIFDMLLGMASGGGIMLFSRLTGGKIGMGDGILFMLTGFYLGAAQNLWLMMISFSLAGVFGGCMLMFGLCRKGDRLPFVPFLFAGYFLMIVR